MPITKEEAQLISQETKQKAKTGEIKMPSEFWRVFRPKKYLEDAMKAVEASEKSPEEQEAQKEKAIAETAEMAKKSAEQEANSLHEETNANTKRMEQLYPNEPETGEFANEAENINNEATQAKEDISGLLMTMQEQQENVQSDYDIPIEYTEPMTEAELEKSKEEKKQEDFEITEADVIKKEEKAEEPKEHAITDDDIISEEEIEAPKDLEVTEADVITEEKKEPENLGVEIIEEEEPSVEEKLEAAQKEKENKLQEMRFQRLKEPLAKFFTQFSRQLESSQNAKSARELYKNFIIKNEELYSDRQNLPKEIKDQLEGQEGEKIFDKAREIFGKDWDKGIWDEVEQEREKALKPKPEVTTSKKELAERIKKGKEKIDAQKKAKEEQENKEELSKLMEDFSAKGTPESAFAPTAEEEEPPAAYKQAA